MNFVLDTKNKTARKMPSPKLMMSDALGEARKKLAESKVVYTAHHPDVKKGQAVVAELEHDLQGAAETKMKAEAAMTEARVMEPGGLVFDHSVSPGPSERESLGTQMIEGVPAEGTRTTITIAAGTIGNDLPIRIVSERWYSPDLHTVVLSKHSDPRLGDTTYRLTNIIRNEPSASLFLVPADYTTADNPQRFVIKTKD